MKNDGYERQSKKVPVNLVLNHVGDARGCALIPMGTKLEEVMNDPNPFFMFEDATGDKLLVAKSAVIKMTVSASTRTAEESLEDAPPSAAALLDRLKQFSSANPYGVLGISPQADRQTISAAYHRLVRKYHPDRLSGMDLPPEMIEHAQRILTLLNQAHDKILQEQKQSAA